MADLIDRNELLDTLCTCCSEYSGGVCHFEGGMCGDYYIIKQMPAVEAEPVKHKQIPNVWKGGIKNG